MLSNGSETYRTSRPEVAGILIKYNTASILYYTNMINKQNYDDLKSKGFSRAEIACQLNIPEWSLKKIITKEGWGVQKRTIGNSAAFGTINEYSAYWAGFIAADGCVDSKNRLRVMLKAEDITHLEKLKSFLLATHKISVNTTQYNRCSLDVTSSELCADLRNNFLIFPRKTDNIELSIIKEPYMSSFIRGIFDGDGSLCESFSNKNSKTATTYTTFSSGSEQFITDLFFYLQITIGTNGHLQKFSDRKWQIKYNTNDSVLLLNYLYSNAKVYLDRKYNLYNSIVVNNCRKTR